MKRRRPNARDTVALASLAAALLCCGEPAETPLPPGTYVVDGLEVSAIYVPEPAGERAAMYLTIANKSNRADELVKVTTPAAGRADIHLSIDEGGFVRMERADRITIPKGWTVHLEPSSFHVMLSDLKAPLTAGGKIPAHLEFGSGRALNVEARVVTYAALQEMLDTAAAVLDVEGAVNPIR